VLRRFSLGLACFLTALIGSVLAQPSLAVEAKYGDAEFQCVGRKQSAAASYAGSTLNAWAEWAQHRHDHRLDAKLEHAQASLARAFDRAEANSAGAGVDCVEQTASAADLSAAIDLAVLEIVTEISAGLDLADRRDARCAGELVRAAGRNARALLRAEGKHTRKIPVGGVAAERDRKQEKANERFARQWSLSRCAPVAGQEVVAGLIDALLDDVILQTVVAQGLDASEFQPISPVGPIEYEGRTLNPRCAFDDDPDYHFFVKRGSVNKLVVYYQGGGACWDGLTCGVPVCKDGADPVLDDPDGASTGFADLSNPDNPFRDWNIVFVTYCSCDVHFGDADQVYSSFSGPLNVSHRGFQNAKVVEKFARENFLNPDTVFVTGSSAGGYGALFHGGLLHDVWPQAEFKVLGDASNGVITSSFLQNEFENWNFTANLPADVPGVVESITSGEGMVAYLEAVATHFPETAWANYTTAYDGGTGGQTGFYNVMLNNSNPVAALTWWDATCQFNDVMVEQAEDSASRSPSNYRYYIDSGSRHTVWGSDTVYTGQLGSGPQTVAEWVDDMLSFDPLRSPGDDWQNVECEVCPVLSANDPKPPRIPTPPFFNFLGLRVINCP
jgi:hypothetical protein